MRRILIESARRKKRLKRGGERDSVELDDIAEFDHFPFEDILDVDQALAKLSQEAPEKAEVVKLRRSCEDPLCRIIGRLAGEFRGGPPGHCETSESAGPFCFRPPKADVGGDTGVCRNTFD